MTVIKNCLPGPPSRESAVKYLSQGHNRMVRVGFEPKPCWSRARRFNHSTTLPTFIKKFSLRSTTARSSIFKSWTNFLFFFANHLLLSVCYRYQTYFKTVSGKFAARAFCRKTSICDKTVRFNNK